MVAFLARSLLAFAVLVAVAACNAILGLGDPIAGGGPDASSEVAGPELDGQRGDDGPPADSSANAVGFDASAPDREGDREESESAPPVDASSAPDEGTAGDEVTARDDATPPDTGMAVDAPADGGGPCDDGPVGFSCSCMSTSDCVDAGYHCCCLTPTATLCDSVHNCGIYDNGICLP